LPRRLRAGRQARLTATLRSEKRFYFNGLDLRWRRRRAPAGGPRTVPARPAGRAHGG